MRYLILITIILSLNTAVASASERVYSDAEYCDAIYIAEGGLHTKHPYGILAKYKHTTPRQACLNTIKHRRRDWKAAGQGMPFMAFLGATYAPVGSANDPQDLNKNWVKNVNYYLTKGTK